MPECCQGILLRTTNRVTSIDIAFKSRIHLALKHSKLNAELCARNWRLSLRRTSDFREKERPDAVIVDLAGYPLNGRKIRNTIRTAQLLAYSEQRKLSLDDAWEVLRATMGFKGDFNNESTEPGPAVSPASLDGLDFLPPPPPPDSTSVRPKPRAYIQSGLGRTEPAGKRDGSM